MLNKLNGYKTYIVGVLIIADALIQWLGTGTIDEGRAHQMLALGLTALGLRHAIGKKNA